MPGDVEFFGSTQHQVNAINIGNLFRLQLSITAHHYYICFRRNTQCRSHDLLTFFIRASWMADAIKIKNGNWGVIQQFGVQATAVGIAIAYAGIGTFIILFVLNKFIKLRSTEEAEMKGLDNFYHGERGYGMTNPN